MVHIMRFVRIAIAACTLFACVARLAATEFKTAAGDVYNGEVSSIDKDGLVIRLAEGGFSPRIDWPKLSEETLKDLSANPKAKRFVEPLLDLPDAEVAIRESKKIELKSVERVALPQTNHGLIAALTAPNGLIMLGAIYLANLYAAYEVARYKWRPVPLVCGLAAVLPVVGPLIFMAFPKFEKEEQISATEAALAESVLTTPTQPAAATSAPPGAAGMGMARGQHAAAATNDALPKVFKRGETTFNRRFFETQFPTFFRVIASEADKDLVIEVDLGKQKIVASRISRISSAEIHFKNSAGVESPAEFAAIVEVKLRHKDA